jgi:hypothetical protein
MQERESLPGLAVACSPGVQGLRYDCPMKGCLNFSSLVDEPKSWQKEMGKD